MDELTHQPYLLPESLQEIAALIGLEPALALARTFGGRKLYCPERLPRHHKLVKTIGYKAAALLCQRYMHEHLQVPSAKTYLRWYDARTLRMKGKSNSAISKEIGISAFQVRILLRGFNPDVEIVPESQELPRKCPACGRAMVAARRIPVRASAQLDFGFPVIGATP